MLQLKNGRVVDKFGLSVFDTQILTIQAVLCLQEAVRTKYFWMDRTVDTRETITCLIVFFFFLLTSLQTHICDRLTVFGYFKVCRKVTQPVMFVCSTKLHSLSISFKVVLFTLSLFSLSLSLSLSLCVSGGFSAVRKRAVNVLAADHSRPISTQPSLTPRANELQKAF